ncbi:acetylserotonin O-methyltransferase [Streptomyces sp. SHP 1-2]|uniref:acetylserotonin O-methyltransferase n=1 Tax=Streptomyces sp. SHP 1-2 TaxID=2769489 RepID=UPI0022378D17|nr:acetylserotonin O-methyltransferase [Streptomyces sp. SHP 1-2]
MPSAGKTGGEVAAGATPMPLMRLLDGFRASQVLASAVRLELFDALAAHGPLSVSRCAELLGLRERPAGMLLAACASFGLVERTAAGYGNSPLAARYLVAGRPHYFGDFVRLVEQQQYRSWAELPDVLRADGTAGRVPQAERRFAADEADRDPLFWRGMSSGSAFTAEAVARSYDFSRFRRLLDLGGGQGDFSLELCRSNPGLSATVYDLPSVCGLARERIARDGYAGRIGTRDGDLLTASELPAGHDVMLVSNILHMWDEPGCRAVLGLCLRALEKGGALVVAEAFVDDDGTGPQTAALMSLNMLVHTAGGANRTRREYETWLAEAGFRSVERVGLVVEAPGANGLVVAHK